METIQNLLNDVNDKIKALDTAKQLYSQQLAPEFRVFDFINTDENSLSWILANLLDPNGTHAQKDLFLRQFINICLPNLSKNAIWQPYTPYLAQTSVVTEQTTTASNTQRRMDIYLSLGDKTKFGICIENKPYASDQQNQMFDYEIEMRKRHQENFHLVYLCENGEPTDWSVPAKTLEAWKASNLISFVTYTQLVEWLTSCKTACQNQSVIEFINQFIKFIQKQFMGVEDMSESQSIIESILSNKENLATSFKIFNSIETIRYSLIKKLITDLESLNRESESPYKISTTEMNGKCGDKIIFSIPNNTLAICFEFEGSAFNMPALGVFIPNKKIQQGQPQFDKITDVLSKSFPSEKLRSSTDWCYWYQFQPRNWWSDSEAWEMIYTGDMAKKIIKEVDNFYNILKENNLLTV